MIVCLYLIVKKHVQYKKHNFHLIHQKKSFLISIFITLMDVISNNHLKDSCNHKLKVQSKKKIHIKKDSKN
jgi:hypothetical protein